MGHILKNFRLKEGFLVHGHKCANLVFIGASNDVKEEIYTASVDTSQSLKHDDLSYKKIENHPILNTVG